MTRWSDGSRFSYNNFSTFESSDGCSYLKMDGVWGIGDCSNLTHVICKRGKIIFLLKEPPRLFHLKVFLTSSFSTKRTFSHESM